MTKLIILKYRDYAWFSLHPQCNHEDHKRKKWQKGNITIVSTQWLKQPSQWFDNWWRVLCSEALTQQTWVEQPVFRIAYWMTSWKWGLSPWISCLMWLDSDAWSFRPRDSNLIWELMWFRVNTYFTLDCWSMRSQ